MIIIILIVFFGWRMVTLEKLAGNCQPVTGPSTRAWREDAERRHVNPLFLGPRHANVEVGHQHSEAPHTTTLHHFFMHCPNSPLQQRNTPSSHDRPWRIEKLFAILRHTRHGINNADETACGDRVSTQMLHPPALGRASFSV